MALELSCGIFSTCPASPVLYNFDSEELQRALEEQSFGITGFQLARSTGSLESFARVTLLEGNVVCIGLSARGYRLITRYGGEIYETIETLLHSISPLYEQMRQEYLVSRLERWS